MKNPWVVAIYSGVFFAIISILVIRFEIRFRTPFKDIFEVGILFCTIITPQLLIRYVFKKQVGLQNLTFQGWISFGVYISLIFLYFITISTGSFSGTVGTMLIAFGIAFVISLVSAFLFTRNSKN